ncbi:MAG: VTT domain-containing protein [Candidatus Geothermarchaeales archaeon]
MEGHRVYPLLETLLLGLQADVFDLYLLPFVISLALGFVPFLSGAEVVGMASVIGMSEVDPVLLGIFSGLGAGLGKISSYFYGRGAREYVLKGRYRRKFDIVERVFGRYMFLAVLVGSATPMPDDFIFIPVGMMKYSLWKTVLGLVSGKIALSIVLASGGLYALNLLGLEGQISVTTSLLLVLAFLGLMVLYLKLDIEGWIERRFLA